MQKYITYKITDYSIVRNFVISNGLTRANFSKFFLRNKKMRIDCSRHIRDKCEKVCHKCAGVLSKKISSSQYTSKMKQRAIWINMSVPYTFYRES